VDREAAVLSDDVERCVTLRRTLGAKLHKGARQLQSFARFAEERGEFHIRAATAVAWATEAPTPGIRSRRLGAVIRFARFLRAENTTHEVPAANIYAAPTSRLVPYIYTPEELARILDAASQLRLQKPNPLRRQLCVTRSG
jgi:integrase/recombinase XerD